MYSGNADASVLASICASGITVSASPETFTSMVMTVSPAAGSAPSAEATPASAGSEPSSSAATADAPARDMV